MNNKEKELKSGDIISINGKIVQIDTIISQLTSIKDLGGMYEGDILIQFYDKKGEFYDLNSQTTFDRISMYTEELVRSTWKDLDVSYKVRSNINKYFEEEKSLHDYEVMSVARHSNHPNDSHLYMVSAVNRKTGEYAVWTSWNDKTKSLNFGHYGLKPRPETVLELFDNSFFDGFSEIKKEIN